MGSNDREVSTAPKERVNIRYRSASDEAEDVELPLRILMLGDFSGAPSELPLEERKPIDINKENFAEVMRAQGLSATVEVDNHLAPDEGTMTVSIPFEQLNDFRPEGIVERVDRLRELKALRDALKQLKDPVGNTPAFMRRIQEILTDPGKRAQLMRELGLDNETES